MLLNKKAVKEFTLKVAADERPASGFSRVSEKFITRMDAKLREWIRDEVKRHPSKGKTIQ